MDFMILRKWFHENHMVLNPGKCHYIVIGDDDPSHKRILNNNEIASSSEEKLLGILLGSKSQPAFTCSKLTIETLEYANGVVLVSLLLTLNILHTLF